MSDYFIGICEALEPHFPRVDWLDLMETLLEYLPALPDEMGGMIDESNPVEVRALASWLAPRVALHAINKELHARGVA